MHLIAVEAMLDGWWGPVGSGVGSQFSALLAWVPWPPSIVVPLFVATGASLVLLVFESNRFGTMTAELPQQPAGPVSNDEVRPSSVPEPTATDPSGT